MHGKPWFWPALFLLTLLSGCGSGGGGGGGSDHVLQSIAVTPANPSIVRGSTQQFTAIGTYADGSFADLTATVTWESDDPALLGITSQGGLASAHALSTTTIRATLDSVTGTTSVTVTAALRSISITPSNPTFHPGETQQFTATGNYSDGSTKDLTNTVTWTTVSSSIATIQPNGLARGISPGTTTLRARSGTQSASTPLTITPASGMTFVVRSPSSGSRVGAVFRTGVAVGGPVEISAVTAEVEGHSANLTFSTNDAACKISACWTGDLNIEDLPPGFYELKFVATDALDHSESWTHRFLHDSKPTISVTAPASMTVFQQSVHVSASCLDDDPSGCASLVASVCSRNGGSCIATRLEGVATVDGEIDVQELDGLAVSVFLHATDSRGQETTVSVPIFVESSSQSGVVEEVPGTIWDADTYRILYIDNDQHLQIHDRISNVDTEISATASTYGFLTDTGAVFLQRSTNPFNNSEFAKSWEAGSLVDLGLAYNLLAKGSFAIWNADNGGTLLRRDVVTHTTDTVSSNAGEGYLAADGTVSFYTRDYVIGLYSPDRVTSWLPTDMTRWNVYPLTDGSNVVYVKTSLLSEPHTDQLIVYRNGTELTLVPATEEYLDGRYRIAGGWVAYAKPGPSNVFQVWRASPTNVTTQITVASTDSSVEHIATDGTLILRTGTRRYRVPPDDTTQTDIGSTQGKIIAIDDVAHIAIGGTLLAIQ